MTLGWKCKYSWISEFSDQMVPILLQRKICIEMISKTKRNPVISAKAQNFAQPLLTTKVATIVKTGCLWLRLGPANHWSQFWLQGWRHAWPASVVGGVFAPCRLRWHLPHCHRRCALRLWRRIGLATVGLEVEGGWSGPGGWGGGELSGYRGGRTQLCHLPRQRQRWRPWYRSGEGHNNFFGRSLS